MVVGTIRRQTACVTPSDQEDLLQQVLISVHIARATTIPRAHSSPGSRPSWSTGTIDSGAGIGATPPGIR